MILHDISAGWPCFNGVKNDTSHCLARPAAPGHWIWAGGQALHPALWACTGHAGGWDLPLGSAHQVQAAGQALVGNGPAGLYYPSESPESLSDYMLNLPHSAGTVEQQLQRSWAAPL